MQAEQEASSRANSLRERSIDAQSFSTPMQCKLSQENNKNIASDASRRPPVNKAKVNGGVLYKTAKIPVTLDRPHIVIVEF